ncbi:STAS domain-containing protein [Actinoplanes couchii]|nr:STAS domain-containing protein [Actinoplanes couchii]
MRCEIEPVGTRLIVRIRGELTLLSVPRVRAALLKCLADHPDAIVADLTGVTVIDPAAASVFPSVARQASLWPGVPVLVVAPDPEVARLISTGPGRYPVFPSVEAALTAEPRPRMPSIGETLLPVRGSAHRARELATEACVRWSAPTLIGPAGVVADELVTNAVVHANTMIDLRLTRGRRYLIIGVRDGSAAEPVLPEPSEDPDAPRGLLLVDAMAARWGVLPAPDGKVVWATLRGL